MSSNEEVDFDEYYKLKNNYDIIIKKEKKNIINDTNLGWKEKKQKFQKYKPKCILCKKPGGTIFSTTFDEEHQTRILSAKCGNVLNPCNLNITINTGNYTLLPSIINEYEKNIENSKKEIINDKNKLLFGYITTEEILEKFEVLKEQITDETSILDSYLNMYYDVIDNKKKNENLSILIERSYNNIQSIKEAILNFDKTNEKQYIHDAVEIYINNLTPKLNDILKFKYKKNMVWFDEDTNNYHLIQEKYTNKDIEVDIIEATILKNDVILKAKQPNKRSNKNKNIIIESNSTEINSDNEINNSVNNIIPKFNEDGTIDWHNEDYQTIWNKLTPSYKAALLTDHEWLQETIDNYVKFKKEGKTKTFINPSNLIVPPQFLDDNNYDFGNEIYNNIFNKLDNNYKNTLLKLKTEKNGIISYEIFLDTISRMVAKEVGFSQY